MKLTIQQLTKVYPNGVKALDGVDLTIENGMFGLLGPNGAGKSTLMRTISTLQEADSGSIFLDDLNVLEEKQEVRKLLGYLPQTFGVYPDVSAEEMLDHFARLKGIRNRTERNDVVDRLLEQTNLSHVRTYKVGTFSGGMRQRFGIAQALLGNPKLIIVDEPTAGLDPSERQRFQNLLAEIGEQIIVILSTHIVEDVSDLCQQMAIMNRGRVIERGSPQELITQVQGKIWGATIEKDALQVYTSKHQVISYRHFGGKLRIRAYQEGQPAPEFEALPANLEDIYFYRIRQVAETSL
ncbi:MAG: ABC transporter ATP-binding protein [Bacteroidota bacterium]